MSYMLQNLDNFAVRLSEILSATSNTWYLKQIGKILTLLTNLRIPPNYANLSMKSLVQNVL